jgi:hypothetical protein
VSQACSVIISLAVHKNLGFVFEAAEGGAVDEAVSVALESGPEWVFLFRTEAAEGLAAVSVWGKPPISLSPSHAVTKEVGLQN